MYEWTVFPNELHEKCKLFCFQFLMIWVRTGTVCEQFTGWNYSLHSDRNYNPFSRKTTMMDYGFVNSLLWSFNCPFVHLIGQFLSDEEIVQTIVVSILISIISRVFASSIKQQSTKRIFYFCLFILKKSNLCILFSLHTMPALVAQGCSVHLGVERLVVQSLAES